MITVALCMQQTINGESMGSTKKITNLSEKAARYTVIRIVVVLVPGIIPSGASRRRGEDLQIYAELSKALERKLNRACPRGFPASFQAMHQDMGSSYRFQLLPLPLMISSSPHFHWTKTKKMMISSIAD